MTNELPNPSAHWLMENEQAIIDFAESRGFRKLAEAFEYGLEDAIFELPLMETAPQFEEMGDSDRDEHRMDLVYEIMRRAINNRWTNN